DPLLRRARSALARSRSRHACAQGQDLARRGFVVGCLDAALLRSRRALLPAVQGAPALRRRRLRPRRGEATARSPALLRRPAAHPPRARTPGARRDPRLPLSRTPSRAPAMRSCVSSPLCHPRHGLARPFPPRSRSPAGPLSLADAPCATLTPQHYRLVGPALPSPGRIIRTTRSLLARSVGW